jgi:guanylate kinase
MARARGGAFKGRLIVLSAPSGAGKTTIAREIVKRIPSLRFSVSATTRPKRNGETEGVDYYFLPREEFQRRVGAGEFVEWEELFGNLYGTLRSELDRALRDGRHLLFDVDVKGGLSIQRAYPSTLMIFIRPPDMAVLTERLRGRKTETEAMLADRLKRVPMEMEMGTSYRHQVLNDDLQVAVREVEGIIQNFIEH